jgi:hypothetical protein
VSGQLYVRAKAFEREAWASAAAACQMSTHLWMRTVLNAASGLSELPMHLSKIRSLPKP